MGDCQKVCCLFDLPEDWFVDIDHHSQVTMPVSERCVFKAFAQWMVIFLSFQLSVFN